MLNKVQYSLKERDKINMKKKECRFSSMKDLNPLEKSIPRPQQAK